jgi:hypothetical protein
MSNVCHVVQTLRRMRAACAPHAEVLAMTMPQSAV